jgi:hypothetical protein
MKWLDHGTDVTVFGDQAPAVACSTEGGIHQETTYSTRLKVCAAWLGQEVRVRTKAGFKAFVRQELGDWNEAFSAYGDGATERS